MNATMITNTLVEIRESKNMKEMVHAIELIRPFLQMNTLLADPAYDELMHEVTKDLAWMQDVNIAVRDLQCTLRILNEYAKKYHGAYFDKFTVHFPFEKPGYCSVNLKQFYYLTDQPKILGLFSLKL